MGAHFSGSSAKTISKDSSSALPLGVVAGAGNNPGDLSDCGSGTFAGAGSVGWFRVRAISIKAVLTSPIVTLSVITDCNKCHAAMFNRPTD